MFASIKSTSTLQITLFILISVILFCVRYLAHLQKMQVDVLLRAVIATISASSNVLPTFTFTPNYPLPHPPSSRFLFIRGLSCPRCV